MLTFFPRYKWAFFSIVLLLSIILIVLAVMAFAPVNDLPTKNITLTPTPKIVDLCAPFTTDTGEISCEEAKVIVLTKYPGQLLSVDKTTLPYQPGKLAAAQTEQRKVWLIGVKPNDISSLPSVPKGPNSKELQIIETIKVAVDRSTKNILFFEPFFKK